jgi:hypothetical protein
MLPPHNPPQPPQAGQPAARPNVVWSLMPPPHVAFQMWIDGSVKINFAPHLADQVIQCLENHLTAYKGMKAMLDNPPKKCTGCRGSGQIMVKKGDQKEATVCPKCKGSGLMNFVPPSVQAPTAITPAKPALPQAAVLPQTQHIEFAQMTPQSAIPVAATRPLIQDDVPPAVALPHEQLQPIDLDSDLLPKMQGLLRKHGYKVVALTKDDVAEDLARFTAGKAEEKTEPKTEPPTAPIEEEDNGPSSSPTLSLEELAALGDQS